MRIRQTARKSTASRNPNDPVQNRMNRILHTKRNSTGSAGDAVIKQQQQRQQESHSGRHSMPAPSTSRNVGLGSRGKQISFKSRDTAQDVKVRPRAMAGQVALAEIRRLQKSTTMLIPRAPFHRVVREVTQDVEAQLSNQLGIEAGPFKYQIAALEALQEAAEAYMVNLFEDAYMCTIHAKRVTLFTSDMELCRKIRRS